MQSEFYNVALDRIRYSLVWEDSETLYQGLQLQPEDKVLVITSAGCNVLNCLLKNPAKVTAIDLNPVQNQLLRLKKYLILHFEHTVLSALLGLEKPETVAKTWQKVAPEMPADLRAYWSPFFRCHPAGLLMAGKLEGYLTGFYGTLPKLQQQQLRKLIQFDDVTAQRDFFLSTLHKSTFRQQFVTYFDEANLSKGRDPKLFKYAQESGGEAFYQRLKDQVSSVLVKDNFFFRFFFFGPEDLPESILPPCYREENFQALRQQLHKLQIVTGEAVDYLYSEAGKEITKASLSNIFEYTSEIEFRAVCDKLYSTGTQAPQIVFWNLLQDQGIPEENDNWETSEISDCSLAPGACFYFRNVRVLTPSYVSVSV